MRNRFLIIVAVFGVVLSAAPVYSQTATIEYVSTEQAIFGPNGLHEYDLTPHEFGGNNQFNHEMPLICISGPYIEYAVGFAQSQCFCLINYAVPSVSAPDGFVIRGWTGDPEPGSYMHSITDQQRCLSSENRADFARYCARIFSKIAGDFGIEFCN